MQERHLEQLSAPQFAMRHVLGTLDGKEYEIDPATLGRFSSVEEFVDWLSSDSFDEAANTFTSARQGSLGVTMLELDELKEYIQSLGERETSFQLGDDESLEVLNGHGLGLQRSLPPPRVAGVTSKLERRRSEKYLLADQKKRAQNRVFKRQASKARFSAQVSKRLSLSKSKAHK